MPQDWTEPEVALNHRGVEVYHIYKYDDIQGGSRDTWYTLSPLGSDDDGHGTNGVFHTDELPDIPEELEAKYTKYPAWEQDIRYAIDSGYFKDWSDLEQDLDPAELKPEGWTPRKRLPRPEMLEAFWKHIDPSPDGYFQKIQDLLTYLTDEQLDAVLENMHVFEEEETDAEQA